MPDSVLRPLRTHDFEDLCSLTNAANLHDRVPQVSTLDEFIEDLDDDHVVLATDTRAAMVDGDIVGYVYTFHLPSPAKEERCYVFGRVHPEHRRRGIGTALMRWGIERATEQLRSTGSDLPAFVRTPSQEGIDDAAEVFARLGLRPVRYTDELLRPLTDLPSPRPVEGVRVVAWPDGRDEEIRVEKNISFLDHWGSTPTAAHHWQQMVRGHGARPDLSFVALDHDDRVVAHCLNKRFDADDELLGRRDAWIDNLGTLPEWRGRGVASALIAASLHAFAAEGLTHASIGVDSENPSGAVRLYRSLGFEPNLRVVTHELRVR